MQKIIPFGLSLWAAAVLSACVVGPNFRPPQTPAAVFHHSDAQLVAGQSVEARWWTQFGDPTLEALVQQALHSNIDLRGAVARVSEARALFKKPGCLDMV